MLHVLVYIFIASNFAESNNNTGFGKLTSQWLPYQLCQDQHICQWERLHKCTRKAQPWIDCGSEAWKEEFQGCQSCTSGTWELTTSWSPCMGTGCSDTVQQAGYSCSNAIDQPNCKKVETRYCKQEVICKGQWTAWTNTACVCAGETTTRTRKCELNGRDSGSCALPNTAYTETGKTTCKAPTTCNQGKLITWSSWSTCGCAGARGFRQRTCLTNCRPQDTQQTEECTDCPTTTSTTTTATTTATRTTNQEIVTFHANPRIAKKSLDQEGTPGPSNGTTATVGGFEKDSQAVGSDRAVIIVTASVVVAVLLMVIVVLLCRVKRNHNIKTQAFPIHVQAEPAAETTWLPEVAVYHMTPRSPSRSCPNINRPLPDTPPQGRRPTKPPRRNRPSGQTLQHSLSADNVLLENTYAECGPSQTLLGTNSPTMSSSNQYLRPIN